MPSISGRRAHDARKLEINCDCDLLLRGNHDCFILKSLLPLLSFSFWVNFILVIDNLPTGKLIYLLAIVGFRSLPTLSVLFSFLPPHNRLTCSRECEFPKKIILGAPLGVIMHSVSLCRNRLVDQLD